eukprot:1269243-Prymnesium_polylepis.1
MATRRRERNQHNRVLSAPYRRPRMRGSTPPAPCADGPCTRASSRAVVARAAAASARRVERCGPRVPAHAPAAAVARGGVPAVRLDAAQPRRAARGGGGTGGGVYARARRLVGFRRAGRMGPRAAVTGEAR